MSHPDWHTRRLYLPAELAVSQPAICVQVHYQTCFTTFDISVMNGRRLAQQPSAVTFVVITWAAQRLRHVVIAVICVQKHHIQRLSAPLDPVVDVGSGISCPHVQVWPACARTSFA